MILKWKISAFPAAPLIAIALGFIAAPGVFAQASLVDATPAADAVIRGGTVHIVLKFDSHVDLERSSIGLIASDAKSDAPPISVVMMSQDAPDTLHATTKNLTRGVYRVNWKASTPDGHTSSGDYQFRVK
jgi:methionine-rich copper-binding protein CopC